MSAESDERLEVARPATGTAATGDVTDNAPDGATGGAMAGATGGAMGSAASATGAVGGTPAGATAVRPLGSRAPRFIKARRSLHVSWQVGVFLVGLAVVVVGIIMLPLPGPGWFVIFAGMAIWATEFVWAQLILRWTKHKVTEAAQRALDPKVRRRNLILTTTGLVIAGALIAIYVWSFGLAMPWKINQ